MSASSDFERILVKDDRIGCITDKIKYGVLKGGQNVTSQTFKAISSSPSAHVFNIAVPSLETIIDREVLWTSDLTFKKLKHLISILLDKRQALKICLQ